MAGRIEGWSSWCCNRVNWREIETSPGGVMTWRSRSGTRRSESRRRDARAEENGRFTRSQLAHSQVRGKV